VFQKLCEDLKSDHKYLSTTSKCNSCHEATAWAVFKLCDELKIFLEVAKPELTAHFQNGKFVSHLAHLVDIFQNLNQLSLNTQEKGKYIIQFVDFTNAYVKKLCKWRCRVKKSSSDMITVLHICVS